MNKMLNQEVAKWFLVPWSLVSAWCCLVWFFRIYERGFRYNPYILKFEFGWSRVLLLVFGMIGILIYEKLKTVIPGWCRVLYVLLITVAAAVLILDLIISMFVTPAL